MRVRTGRFQPDDQVSPIARQTPRGLSLTPHASHPGLPVDPLAHSGSSWTIAARRSGASRPVRSFTRVEASGYAVQTGVFQPPARRLATMTSADFPRHFLLGISPGKNALVAAPFGRCRPGRQPGSASLRLPARPPHLPPRLDLWALPCCAGSPAASAFVCGLPVATLPATLRVACCSQARCAVRRPAGFR